MEEPAATTGEAPPLADTASEDLPETLDQALGGGELIDEIQQSLGERGEPGAQPVAKMELEELESTAPIAGATIRDLDLLADVEVEVAVEFGRTRIPLRQLLTLRRGALVELNRRPETQVTVLANGTPIALGDVVVVNDQIGVHIVELIEPKAPAVEPEDMSLPLTEVLDDNAVSPGVVAEAAASDPAPQSDLADGSPAAEAGGA